VSVSEEQLLLALCSGGQKGWHVFYHFVGAVPGSTELLGLLCRLLYEMKALPVNTRNDDDDDDDDDDSHHMATLHPREPFSGQAGMENPKSAPLRVLGVNRSKDCTVDFPRIFLRVFIVYRLILGFLYVYSVVMCITVSSY